LYKVCDVQVVPTDRFNTENSIDVMNPQSRMAKTLACLVGAMTSGALVLHWIQPSAPPTDNRYAVQLIAKEVQNRVRPDTVTSRGQWEAVLVRADGAHGAHFVVSEQGQLLTTLRWRSQAVAGADGQIVVCLDTATLSEDRLSPAQATTLVALLTELKRSYLEGEGTIRLDRESFPIVRPDRGALLAQHCHDLLRIADLCS